MIILLITIVQASIQSCENYMLDLMITAETEGHKQLLKMILPYASLSGSSLNQFGMFEACLRRGFFYSSLKIDMDPLPNYYGLCHPTVCTTEDLNDEQLQDDVKEMINETGILNKYNISLDDADFIFYNPLTFRKEYGILFAFSLILLGIMLILTIVNPLNEYLSILVKTTDNPKYHLEENYNNEESGMLTNNPQEKTYKKKKQTLLHDFSMTESYKSLFSFKEYDSSLSIMEGFRSLGFLMVIFGHQFLDLAKSSFKFEMLTQIKSWLCLNLVNMFYSVDMFLWIGGFFGGYLLYEKQKLRQIKKNGFTVLAFLLHRILRIWPCYAIAILICSQLVPYIGDGPRWFMTLDRLDCSTGWRNLLFIDNLFYDTKYCFPWGWYLSTDMQLFSISLLPLLIYAKVSSKFSKDLIILLLIITQIIGTVMSFEKEYMLPAFAFTQPNMYQDYYTKPFTRAPPYFLGLLLGVLYREYKDNNINILTKLDNKKSQLFRIVCYISGGGIICFLWFGWRPAQLNWEKEDYWNRTVQQIWFAFCRLGFTFGMTLISLPCLFGMKDMFNFQFMRNNYFRFINKISFSGYLMHQIIIFGILGQFYQTPNFSFNTVFTLYVGNLAITIICSIAFCILIELPLGKVEHRLMYL